MSLFAGDEPAGAAVADPAAAPAAAVPAAAPGSAAAEAAWLNADGTLVENWVDRLPEGLRGEKSLAMFKDLPTLAKSLVETKKLVGRKFEMPGPDAPPERIEEWRKIVGAPKDANGYGETLRPEEIPEAMWDGTLEKGIKEVFHKHHAPPALVQEVVGLYGQAIKAQMEGFQQEEKAYLLEQKAGLQKEWGQDMSRRLGVAQEFAKSLGLDPNSPEFANAAMVKAMYHGATLYGGGSTLKDGGKPATAAASVGEQIRDIQDPGSQTRLARAYRGEFGRAEQLDAQAVLHNLMGAK